jgi:hypothetical protein
MTRLVTRLVVRRLSFLPTILGASCKQKEKRDKELASLNLQIKSLPACETVAKIRGIDCDCLDPGGKCNELRSDTRSPRARWPFSRKSSKATRHNRPIENVSQYRTR